MSLNASNYPPGVTGSEPQITGELVMHADASLKACREESEMLMKCLNDMDRIRNRFYNARKKSHQAIGVKFNLAIITLNAAVDSMEQIRSELLRIISECDTSGDC